MELVHQMVYESAQRLPDKIAVADANRSLTYEQLARTIDYLAAGLQASGLQPGDRAMVVLPNCVDFFVAHFAVMAAGGISVPCDWNMSEAVCRRIAQSCRPRQLLTSWAGRARMQPIAAELGTKDVICLGDPTGGAEQDAERPPVETLAAADLIDSRLSLRRPKITEDHLTALMYTTGTTGLAKGVQVRHRNVLPAIRNLSRFVGFSQEDREVITLPLSHNFGLQNAYCDLMVGGSVRVEHGMSRVGRVLNAVSEFQATGFPATPMGLGLLIDHYSSVFAERCRGLRFIVVNSAPLPPRRTRQLRELLPQTEIFVYYGLTEACKATCICLTRSGEEYYASVGKPFPDVRLEIVDDRGRPLPVGKTGEVVIDSPTVAAGYWENPDATAEVFRDGKVYTRDLGYLDEKGFLFITGRKDDVINVGGYKVFPAEVEHVIGRYPGIRNVAVGGAPLDAADGQLTVAAAIVVDASEFDGLAGLKRFCHEHLESWKVPTRFFQVENIPSTATGKIKRAELAELLQKADEA